MVGQTLRKALFFLLNSKLLMDPISWKNYLSKDINYTFLSEKKVRSVVYKWGFWDKLFSSFFQSRTTFQNLLNILKHAFRYIIQPLHRMIYSTYSSKSFQLNSISLKLFKVFKEFKEIQGYI